MHPSFIGRSQLRSGLAVATAAAVVTAGLATGPVAAEEPTAPPGAGVVEQPYRSGNYVVLLRQDSAAQRDESDGARSSGDSEFDADAPAVRAYERRLRRQQRRVAGSVGARIGDQFTLASNGFTSRLSGKQAENLATDKRVLLVVEDEAFDIDTWNTPEFLGLEKRRRDRDDDRRGRARGRDGDDDDDRRRRGVWYEHGGPDDAGDGVVVGVLDTGIWPESDSFAGERLDARPSGRWKLRQVGDQITMRKADGETFSGTCETGEEFTVTDCNSKIVGARYYPDSFLNAVPPEQRAETEYLSPRDGGGHGSHTAGTSVGNHGVEASVEGRDFGDVSGMAPAAKLAVYKVCFEDTDPNTGGCYTSSTLDAIEDAIGDGVDVINFSISGATDTVVDAVEYAFAGAASAGVFVAASAGNSGPGASTVAHNSPWVTTVAASTHTRFENTVVLGNGDKVKGASIASADQLPATTPLVHSVDVGQASADPEEVRLCYPGTLDPAKVAGTIVLCERGAIARVDKSAAVAEAGGTAMVLGNTGPNSLDADFHSVPTVHVDSAGTETVTSYLASATDPTASFEAGDTTGGEATPVPQVAGFSSRGPAVANDSDVLKPDITGPGVSVLAAVAPPTNEGRDFDLYSGTSMSSPHIAGLAAFILGEKPDWSPMAVKSAMMTTAYDLRGSDGGPATDPFAQGAGHVDPTRFFDPGLLVTSDAEDWMRFLQGQGLDLGVEPMEASDLNGPSLADGAVTASTTMSRTFTALRSGRWSVDVDVPGFRASHPRRVKMKRGRDTTVEFGFTRSGAPLDEWATGFVTLRDRRGNHRGHGRRGHDRAGTTVRMPVALRPVALDAPSEVSGTGANGAVTVPVTSGYDGRLDVAATGLAVGDTHRGDLAVGGYDFVPYTVEAGTSVARFVLDAEDDTDDLDLLLLDGDRNLVAVSATGSADESLTIENLAPGEYEVAINAYSAADGRSSVPYRFDGYLVDGSATAGDLSADPASQPVTSGEEVSYDVSWNGLSAGRYLGYVDYGQSDARTFVTVDVAEAGSAG